MNERIRYRQWYKDHWWHWGFIGDWTETGFTGPLCTSDRNDPVRTYPDSFQSTGLRDSTRTKEFPKGKEIWRGSFVRGQNNAVYVVKHGKYLSEYGEEGDEPCYGWYIETKGGQTECIAEAEDCLTVIGDTTTTPDLMKEVRK